MQAVMVAKAKTFQVQCPNISIQSSSRFRDHSFHAFKSLTCAENIAIKDEAEDFMFQANIKCMAVHFE